MTHDELIVLLKDYADSAVLIMDRNPWLILCDVVELHTAGNGESARCESCWLGFPCPTIQAIEKELG